MVLQYRPADFVYIHPHHLRGTYLGQNWGLIPWPVYRLFQYPVPHHIPTDAGLMRHTKHVVHYHLWLF